MTSMRASDSVAERVKKRRAELGWTAADLAEHCADMGAPEITRAVIANIETGRRDDDGRRRRDVTVEELNILAYALKVPPALLMVPVADTDALQVTADVEMDALTAAGWLAGATPTPVPTLLGALARCGSCGHVLWSRKERHDGAEVPVYYCGNPEDSSPVRRDARDVDDFIAVVIVARLTKADIQPVIPDTPLESWVALPAAVRAQLAAALFDRVTLARADDWTHGFDPDTVQVQWSR